MAYELKINHKNFKILTPSGYSDFAAIRKITKIGTVELFTKNRKVKCSIEHPIKIDSGKFELASVLNAGNIIETIDGLEKIINVIINPLEEIELYDLIEIELNNEYYTNGILSHNCQFLTSDQALIDTLKLQRAEKTVASVEETIGELFNQDFWKLPHRNGTYIIGFDPSEGVGQDFAVIEVFEFPSMEQIMEYRSNDQSPATLYSIFKTIVLFFERHSLMTYYSVESNAVGQAIIALYEADEKPPMKAVFMYEEGADRVGFKTTNPQKMKALIAFKEMFERDNIKLNSKILINELKTLVRRENTFKAQTGSTDDCVMAVMICIRIMEQMAEYDMNAFTKLYSFQHVQVDPWAINRDPDVDTGGWEEDMLHRAEFRRHA